MSNLLTLQNKPELEELVLGALLGDPKQFMEVGSTVKPGMFSDWRKDAASHIWQHMQDFKPVNVHTIQQVVKDQEKEKVFGLYKKVNKTGLHFAKQLQQVFFTQEEVSRLAEAQGKLMIGEDFSTVTRWLDNSRTEMLNQTFTATKDYNTYLEVKNRIENPSKYAQGIPTGYSLFDLGFGGWNPGSYNIIAGRPKMGKTTLACWHIITALMQGHGVAFYSYEMTKEDLLTKMACLLAGFNPNKFNLLKSDNPVRQKISQRVDELFELPLHIFDRSELSGYIEDINQHAVMLQAKENIALVALDYIQLLYSYDSAKDEYARVSTVSNKIIDVTQKTKLPFIVLSQMSRAVEGRAGWKRPQLSDLRGSGSLEQDATRVLFVHRPEYYGILEDEMGNSLKGITQYINAADRFNGQIAGESITLRFDENTGKLKEENKDSDFDYPEPPQSITVSAKANADEDVPF